MELGSLICLGILGRKAAPSPPSYGIFGRISTESRNSYSDSAKIGGQWVGVMERIEGATQLVDMATVSKGRGERSKREDRRRRSREKMMESVDMAAMPNIGD